MCVPVVETLAGNIWNISNGPASIAARIEHQQVRADQVRVDFQVKGAIDGGAANGSGAYAAPPSGFIQYANGKQTVAPYIGSASWKCVWQL